MHKSKTSRFGSVFKILLPVVIVFGFFVVTVFLKSTPDLKKDNIVKQVIKLGQSTNKSSLSQSSTAKQEVLGDRTPQIYISGGKEGYSSGGMIALASTDEPSVKIGGHNVSGPVKVSVYKANEDILLDYLIHNKENKQVKKGFDVSSLRLVAELQHQVGSGYDGSKLLLPIGETGIWLLRIKYENVEEDSFVIRSNVGVLAKRGDNETILWGQDFRTRKSVSGGEIKILDLLDGRREITSTNFDSEGIAKTPASTRADIALVHINTDIVVVPINLRYLNTDWNYSMFEPKERQTKYFTFTDRPIYRPGDTVYFKSVLRDDDDVRYSIPSSQVKVDISNGYEEENIIFSKSYPVSPNGTISGEYKLPEGSKTDDYRLTISISGSTKSYSYFSVEYFRKPEYSIDISATDTELVAGDKSSFKIVGSYFSGQPIISREVKYKVYSGDYYDYDYLSGAKYALENDYRWGYWNEKTITEGEVVFDEKGEVVVDLGALSGEDGKSQVYSMEAEFDDGSGNPAFARKNILVYSGEYGIYRRESNSYLAKVNSELVLPVVLVSRRNTGASGISLTAQVKRESWIEYQEEDKKYSSWRKEEEVLPILKTTTDSQGNASFTFVPTKVGSYNFAIEGKDSRGNVISKKFYSYVTSEEQPYYGQSGGLSIQTGKQNYTSNESVTFSISSTIPDRDVFLSLERGRVNRFKIVHLTGKLTNVEIPLTGTDIPNIYAKVSSFSDNYLDDASVNVPVSADSKKLVVEINPGSKTFAPGENVTVNVETKDIGGNPISAEVGLWAVDKAIFELAGSELGSIFETFWSERYDATRQANSLEGIIVEMAEQGGGCFTTGTSVLLPKGKTKAIEEIKVGNKVLTRESENSSMFVASRVTGVHRATVPDIVIINGSLKVTPNHKLWVNNGWMEAGSVQRGDLLTDYDSSKAEVNSVERVTGKFEVYNLEVEKYNTYFADGYWVHNQKGGGGRTVFKDTAYWNPSVHTDSSGRAQVSFKLPDNLTTWVIAAVGSTVDTKVGQNTKDIVVTKDVIVRPILPNIFREGDEVVVSALLQNFTEQNHSFDVGLNFDAGEVKNSAQSNVSVKSKEMQQLYWEVKPESEKDKAKLTFSAKSKEDSKISDTITQEVPVKPFGFYERKVETGDGSKTFFVELLEKINKEKSGVKLSLSPTMLGTLPLAMKYLIDYPYGCVEQTTSRFVPSVIAKVNPGLFAEALKDKDIDAILKKGISKLTNMQHEDGGWAWWSRGGSDSFVTAYVVEYLLLAKNTGADIDKGVLKSAQTFFENQDQQATKEDMVIREFGLTLLGSDKRKGKLTDLDELSPDILSLAVIANALNGDKNPDSNGVNRLIAMAKEEGDSLYWEAGDKTRFASMDASSALAIRAIVMAGGNRETAVKGVRYLSRNKHSDYWANTYATAQVVRAIVDLSKTGTELTPNYTYSVFVDDKEISKGVVTNANQYIHDIDIPIDEIKKDGSNIALTKSGEGQLYSTLLVNEFNNDRDAKAKDNGLKVTREYISERGEDRSLAVGDVVTVKITVDGLKTSENYGVIADELPAGLVPINESLDSEQFNQSPSDYRSYYGVSDTEITENGMILSLYLVSPGEQSYTYKARVISEGTFTTPPVQASLMYAPEVNGRSGVQIVKTTQESHMLITKLPKKISGLMQKLAAVLLIGGVIILAFRKKIKARILKIRLEKENKENNPQLPVKQEQDGSVPNEPVS